MGWELKEGPSVIGLLFWVWGLVVGGGMVSAVVG
jgi:hypothetical protein